jgi:hypothetical protein
MWSVGKWPQAHRFGTALRAGSAFAVIAGTYDRGE